MTEMILVFTNMPNAEVAENVARHLIEEGLAACVNILPPVRSIYKWQGAVETTEEITLLIKTTKLLYLNVEKKIVELHPYKIPEVIGVPIEAGLPSYINWIALETKKDEVENE